MRGTIADAEAAGRTGVHARLAAVVMALGLVAAIAPANTRGDEPPPGGRVGQRVVRGPVS